MEKTILQEFDEMVLGVKALVTPVAEKINALSDEEKKNFALYFTATGTNDFDSLVHSEDIESIKIVGGNSAFGNAASLEASIADSFRNKPDLFRIVFEACLKHIDQNPNAAPENMKVVDLTR